jgi:tetratricopeptide (TPR) repeat protein
MTRRGAENPHAVQGLNLANRAIALGAAMNHAEARLNWQIASDYADEHLEGEDIYYWIKSGLGAALLDVGEYQAAIAVSEVALDWCVEKNQPLASLTIAKSYLKLGSGESAARHIQQARELVGDAMIDQFDPADQEAVRKQLHR